MFKEFRLSIASAIVVLLMGAVTYKIYLNDKAANQQLFDLQAEKALALVKERLIGYEKVLIASGALFGASTNVNFKEWKSFVKELNLDVSAPGLNGLGFIAPIWAKDIKTYERAQQQSGNENFRYSTVPSATPPLRKDMTYVITYIEPEEKNKGVSGLDVGSGINRRSALEFALQSYRFAITHHIQLVQDSVTRAGFLIYFPILENKAIPTTHKTFLFNNKNYIGLVFAPVIAEELFKHVLKGLKADVIAKIEWPTWVYGEPTFETVYKDPEFNTNSKDSIVSYVVWHNQTFQIEWQKSSALMKEEANNWPAVLLISFTIGSLVLALIWSLDRTNKIQFGIIEEQKLALVNSTRLNTLGEMAAGMAHEINNPLGILLGRTQQLERDIRDEKYSTEKRLEILNSIKSAGNRISKIIKSMRAMGRNVEADPMEKINLNDLIQDSLNLCQHRLSTRNVRLEIDPIPQVEIWGREVELSQVLLNLINNAEDAISQQNEKWIHIQFLIQDKVFQIRVTDSGPGIDRKTASKIFKAFFTTKPAGSGTGLGLSISNTIIKQHGGRLFIDQNSPNTCFVVELPISQSS